MRAPYLQYLIPRSKHKMNMRHFTIHDTSGVHKIMELKNAISANFILIFCILLSESNGNIIRHTFNISYIQDAPDGVVVDWVIGINGKFPGPTIEAHVGDILEVTVINNMQDGENVTIHWHGFHQKGSPFEDGPSMITQCPLKQGSKQIYKFVLDKAGSYWYHSHVKAQYTAGLWGVIIVHPARGKELYRYDDEIVITLNEWYHNSFHTNENWYLDPNGVGKMPFPDSVLLNGMGRYPCTYAQLKGIKCNRHIQRRPVFKVSPGKVYRVRVISTSGFPPFDFSIDRHSLRAIEVDSVDLKNPLDGDIVYLDAGQRYSFLLNTTMGTSGDRFLIRALTRTDVMPHPAGNINPYPEVLLTNWKTVTAILEYDDSSTNVEVTSEPFDFTHKIPEPPTNPLRLNERRLEPLDDSDYPEDESISTRLTLEITFGRRPDNVSYIAFNHTPFILPQHHRLPLLARVALGDDTCFNETNVNMHRIPFNTGIELVINNPKTGPHPLHLHGHHFYVANLGRKGDGAYDPVLHRDRGIPRYKRDVVTVRANSYVVLRWMADNPGFWTFHCHIDWHMIGGMVVNFVEGLDIVRQGLPVPDDLMRVCNEHV